MSTAIAGGPAFDPAGSGSGCSGGRRSGQLHTDTQHAGEWRLEAVAEGAAGVGDRRGGLYTESTTERDIEEGVHRRVRIGGPDAADANAGDRDWKRIRASAP